MAYYEAVILFAHAIKKISSNPEASIYNVTSQLANMRNVTIESELGSDIAIGLNGDRTVLYDIKQFVDYTGSSIVRRTQVFVIDVGNVADELQGLFSWFLS